MVKIPNLKKFQRSPFLIVLVGIVSIVLFAGGWFVWSRFREVEPGENSIFSKGEISEALEKAEFLIVNHERYKEIGGKDLELVSFDSDEGELLCTDCEGVMYTFTDQEDDTCHVNVGFIRMEDGSIDITNADVYQDSDDSFFIDLLTGDIVPLMDPADPGGSV